MVVHLTKKRAGYHAVWNYYLKYSWEYFMHKKMHDMLLYCGQPAYLGIFSTQDQLGENYLTYSHIWGSQNTLGKKYALHIQDIQAPTNRLW